MAARTLPLHFDAAQQGKGGWPVWIMIWFLAALVVMTSLSAGSVLHEELHRIARELGDPLWVPYQIGSEYNRLQLAAEEAAPAEQLKVRAEVFLSYVSRITDADQFAEARHAMKQSHLAALADVARRVETLLPQLGTEQGLTRLRDLLRDEALLIHEFVLEMSLRSRKLIELENAQKLATLWLSIVAIGVLLLAFMILAGLAVRFLLKLRSADRERERQYAIQTSILVSVEDGIIGIGPEGKVAYFNQRAGEMFGPGLAVGAAIPASREGGSPLLGHLRRLVDGRGDVCSSCPPVTRSVEIESGGRTRHFVLRMAAAGPKQARERKDDFHVITARDVTVEVEAAQKRNEYDSQISEASRVFSYAVVAGGIVHEISQPLASLRNYIHVLRLSPEVQAASGQFRSMLDDLGLEVGRAMDVVRNVRRMGAQGDEEYGRCNLLEAVANSIRLVSLGSRPPPLIRITGADMRDTEVNGALPLIGQVIVNLLKNGLQSSEAAGRPGAVIHLERHDGCAAITVLDHGSGISPETAERIFLPFVRSSKGGMGLGLAICQRIATNIGGTLTWENREGGGAAFRFSIPLADKE